MPREYPYRRHNDAQDAVLLGWVLILGIVGILYFLAYDRLHVRAGQLVEITIYPSAARRLSVGSVAVQGHEEK